MRPHLDASLVIAAFTMWLHAAWPEALAGPPPEPASPTRAPAAPCGLALTLEAALPAPSTRSRPERAWIRNLEPTPLPLDGFELVSGRQRRPLPALTLAPGELLEVTPPRLRNREGRLSLVDPCGLELAHLAWAQAPHDTLVVTTPATTGPIPLGPPIPSLDAASRPLPRSGGNGSEGPLGAAAEAGGAPPHLDAAPEAPAEAGAGPGDTADGPMGVSILRGGRPPMGTPDEWSPSTAGAIVAPTPPTTASSDARNTSPAFRSTPAPTPTRAHP